ncbi:TolC family protein [Photobacterium leiognathi]|uniref:TolC family protein n=1 Tax=Photobacterium leiognathi TaxID=553611 RepID=UPI001EDD3775|nr:TolC family protein [Photobacterium leiognathi]MCG3883710.1 TolC family protein [Photobacterium leiognathi]
MSNDNWYVGLGVSFTLFDNGGRLQKLSSEKIKLRELSYVEDQLKNELRTATEIAYLAANNQLKELSGLKHSKKLAETSLKMQLISFERGVSSVSEVLDAELALEGINSRIATVKYEYKLARVRLSVMSNNYNNNEF